MQDYSLYMGIHFNTAEEQKEAENENTNCGLTKWFGKCFGLDNGDDLIKRTKNGGILASCEQCRGPKEIGNKKVPEKRSISLYIGIIDMLTKLNLKKRLKAIKKNYIDRACREVFFMI